MGCEQCPGAAGGMNVFNHRPGNGQPIVGSSAPANFIQQDQRFRRGRIQDGRRLGHLNHKRGASAGQIVVGANAGKDAVHNRQARRTRWNKRSHLRHQDNQRGLAQVG